MALLQQRPPRPPNSTSEELATASWEVTNREVIHRYELLQGGRETVHMHCQGTLPLKGSRRGGGKIYR